MAGAEFELLKLRALRALRGSKDLEIIPRTNLQKLTPRDVL